MSSSWWPRATSAVSVISDRLRRSKALPSPDRAPGIFGDEPLEIGGEIGGRRDGPVDVRVAEDLTPNRQPGGIHLVGGRRRRRCEACACSAISAATRTGACGGREMPHAVQHDQPPVLDTGGDALQMIRRSSDVVAARDGEDRRADLLQSVDDVESSQRLTHLGIRAGVRGSQRIEKRRAEAGLPLGEVGGEPPLRRSGEHGFSSRRADGCCTLPPRVRGADRRTGAQQGGRRDPVRRIQQQLQPDATSDRITCVMECFAGELVGECQHARASSAMVKSSVVSPRPCPGRSQPTTRHLLAQMDGGLAP